MSETFNGSVARWIGEIGTRAVEFFVLELDGQYDVHEPNLQLADRTDFENAPKMGPAVIRETLVEGDAAEWVAYLRANEHSRFRRPAAREHVPSVPGLPLPPPVWTIGREEWIEGFGTLDDAWDASALNGGDWMTSRQLKRDERGLADYLVLMGSWGRAPVGSFWVAAADFASNLPGELLFLDIYDAHFGRPYHGAKLYQSSVPFSRRVTS